jgi:hypothetical protein
MERDRPMSRRETFVNTLLGIFLLVVFFVYLTAIGLAFLFGFIALDWIVRSADPGASLSPGFSFLGIWALIVVWSAVGHARNGRWRNAFLLCVSVPLMGFAWFGPISSVEGYGLGFAGLYIFPVFMVIGIAGEETLGRLKFLVATCVTAASVAVNGGLLANGTLSRSVANCLLAVVVVWFITEARAKYKTAGPDPLAFPPAGV